MLHMQLFEKADSSWTIIENVKRRKIDSQEEVLVMSGLFGNAFDLNHDGHLDAFERASEFAFFTSIMEEEVHSELADAGIDPEELEYMSGDERREILEDAGLDPDEYDF
jgi:hypothetical protein